jgi:hypothetical protein
VCGRQVEVTVMLYSLRGLERSSAWSWITHLVPGLENVLLLLSLLLLLLLLVFWMVVDGE